MPPELASMLLQWLESVARDEARKAVAETLGTSGPEYLTTEEAALKARVSVPTIRRWINEGRLVKCGAGKSIRVERAALSALMRSDGKRQPALRAKKIQKLTPEAIAASILDDCR